MSSEALAIDFSKLVPVQLVEIGGLATALIVAAGIVYNLRRWRIREELSIKPGQVRTPLFRDIVSLLLRDVTHRQIAPTGGRRNNWLIHMAIFWGFVGLGVATLMASIMNPHGGPMPLSHPVRIVGNTSGLLFVVGLFLAAYRRYTDADLKRTSIFADHFFLWLMIFVGATGFAAEFAADLEFLVLTALSYYIHLVGVAMLLILAPFTKFVHSVGRPLILLIERRRRIVA